MGVNLGSDITSGRTKFLHIESSAKQCRTDTRERLSDSVKDIGMTTDSRSAVLVAFGITICCGYCPIKRINRIYLYLVLNRICLYISTSKV